jgi:hypothetical protein
MTLRRGNPDLYRAFGYNHDALKAHWLNYGINECRRSSPVFDVRHYLDAHGDLQMALGKNNCAAAVEHWHNYGISEGRASHPDFNVMCYLNRYSDLRMSFGAKNYRAGLTHYLEHGRYEGRVGTCS